MESYWSFQGLPNCQNINPSLQEMECNCYFEDSSYLGRSCGTNPNVTLFMSLVDLMLRSSCRIAQPCSRTQPTTNYDTNRFDFIVIGGGVAGSVVASRLSENKNWRVLLVEAGPEEATTTTVPSFSNKAIGTDLDWKYKTVNEREACLSTAGICELPRGKMMGGSGSISGMMYTRGHKEIYNSWARQGNVGWTYFECLQFFKKAEKNLNPEIIDKLYHGTEGPITVQRFTYKPEMTDDIVKAGQILGYSDRDLNGHNQTGFTIAQIMVDNGIIASTPRMYIRNKKRRNNLFISLNSTVQKVLINKQSKKAFGVEIVDDNGKLRVAYAKKEIILSAGAFGSPHILMLSGVGPAESLQKHGIEVIQDLRVGENLHNHVAVSLNFFIKTNNTQNPLNLNSLNEYLMNHTGPLASTGLTQITGFMHTKYSQYMPDIQMFFEGFSPSCPSDNYHHTHFGYSDDKQVITMRPTNILPKSVGYLTLKSSDPNDMPLIQMNYLTNYSDVEVLKEGIKLAIRLSETEPLKKWGIELDKRPQQNCTQFSFGTDAYWECIIKQYTYPENHPGGSCKMGPHASKGAVVDPELRVHGITNLRVIDASIFPYVPNGNPISAVIMTAEKGSYMIQGAW
ncbi:glucose dehydrogenase [FAD, quinone]-like isoform X1 [Cimex lectularius]|uniref:Glucose-methanol-choline oxidoreductase N-terminal domain-containing protein n=2 Tax=Cimex lectularius TaxID=79782 RepID=A0A8I6R9L6_CIMLE|nr:glucose dehydrogenase [FAD, quinone]-like isoform X1 [Cimex lectularius]